MINVPPCCHTKPFGFIEIKIDEMITRIPLCVKHHDDFEDNNDEVVVQSWVLTAGDKIPGVTSP